jgi:hypothetical protein
MATRVPGWHFGWSDTSPELWRALAATCFSRRSKPAEVGGQHETGMARTTVAHLGLSDSCKYTDP